MMGKRTLGLLASFLLVGVLIPDPTAAQAYGGTGILKIKPGARATGMGQAGVALPQHAHSVWWNPASLATISSKREVSSTVAKLVPDLAPDVYYLNLAGAMRVEGWGGVGIDLMYLSYGETEVATEDEGALGLFFRSYEFAPVIGFGTPLLRSEGEKLLTDIDVGVSVKYVLVDLAPRWAMALVGINKDGRADAFGLDVGVALRGNLYVPYSIGVNVQNLGSSLVFIDADQADPLPRNLKAGVAVDLLRGQSLQLIGVFDFNKSLIRYPDRQYQEGQPKVGWGQTKELLNGGLEASLQERLHLRLGYVYDPEGEIEAMTFGAGLSVGVGGQTLLFDYSSVPQALDLDRVSYLSIGVQF